MEASIDGIDTGMGQERSRVTWRKNSQRHKGVPCDYWCELFGGTGVSGHPRGKELRQTSVGRASP